MKLIDVAAHAILDYIVVLIFAVAPFVLDIGTLGLVVSLALAAVHLLMTVATDFPRSPLRLVPLALHSIVELVVGILLIVAALLVSAFDDGMGQAYFAVMGVVIVLVWLATDYAGTASAPRDVPDEAPPPGGPGHG